MTREQHLTRLAERLLSTRERERLARGGAGALAAEEGAETEGEDAGSGALQVRLGGELFAIPVRHVEEVVVDPTVAPVPRARPEVCGVFLHRGQLVPLLETVALVRGVAAGSGAASAAKAPVVVVSHGDDLLGLRVEEVLGIVDAPAEAWQELPDAGWSYVLQAARFGGQLTGLLHVDAIAALPGNAAEGPAA